MKQADDPVEWDVIRVVPFHIRAITIQQQIHLVV